MEICVKHEEESGAQLFTHAGTTYCIGDWVALKNDSERDWVAKIVGFDPCEDPENKDEGIGNIRCQWAWYLDDLKAEVLTDLDLDTYSEYEVVLSQDFVDSNPVGSIKHKLQVLPYEEFILLENYPRTSPSQFPPPIIFYRQTFNSNTGLEPRLSLDIIVKVNINGECVYGSRNPDLVYYRCSECHHVYYPKAFDETATVKKKSKPNETDIAFVCLKCENQLNNPLVVGKINEDNRIDSSTNEKKIPERKCKVLADIQKQCKTEVNNYNNCVTNNNYSNNVVGNNIVKSSQAANSKKRNLNRKTTDEEGSSVSSSERSIKKFLSSKGSIHMTDGEQAGEELSHMSSCRSLSSPPSKVAKDSNNQDIKICLSSSSSATKVSNVGCARQQINSNDCNAAVKQLRSQQQYHYNYKDGAEPSVLNVRDLRKSKILECLQRGIYELQQKNELHLMKFPSAEALAELIEDEFFKRFGSKDARQQKQRFFDIYSNLKRENNASLRKRVLSGDMSASVLVTVDTQELAPESLRKEREAEQRKYFAEQVLLKGVAIPVLRLTHKGLEEISAVKDEGDNNNLSGISLSEKTKANERNNIKGKKQSEKKSSKSLTKLKLIKKNKRKIANDTPSSSCTSSYSSDANEDDENSSNSESNSSRSSHDNSSSSASDSSSSGSEDEKNNSDLNNDKKALQKKDTEKVMVTNIDSSLLDEKNIVSHSPLVNDESNNNASTKICVDNSTEIKPEGKTEEKKNVSILKNIKSSIKNDNNENNESNIKIMKKKKYLLDIVPIEYKDVLLPPPDIDKFGVHSIAMRLKSRLEKMNNSCVSNTFAHFIDKGLSRIHKLQNSHPTFTQRSM